MRLNGRQKKAYTYTVITPPAALPLSLEIVKSHLNINHSLSDPLLNLYIGSATSFAEKFTRRCIINRTIKTFRDSFPNEFEGEGFGNGIEIRRSPLSSISSISYENSSGIQTTVDPLTYYNTLEEDYSEVLLYEGECWPSDVRCKMQAIEIEFVCGMAVDDSGVDDCWKDAILSHIAMLWANRGDCSDGGCLAAMPASSKAFYEQKQLKLL